MGNDGSDDKHGGGWRRWTRWHALEALIATAVGLGVLTMVMMAVRSTAAPPVDMLEGACYTENPFFATACYARGGEYDEPAIVAFHDSLPDTAESDHFILATQRQVGSTNGLAYVPAQHTLYAAAYHKRGSAFGPGGPGAIYKVNLATGEVSQWLTVPGAGIDQHDRTNKYWPDTRARNFVGVLGLGDIDVNPDGTELYVMQLVERQIYRYRLSDKVLIGKIPIGSGKEKWANDARPFALAVWRGKLFHGVVDSANKSQQPGELAAYVYESDLDGSHMRLVNTFSLNYNRGNAVYGVPARWQVWKDGYNAVGGGGVGGGGRRGGFGFSVYPMPMLTDIVFADNGDMVMGFRDRNGDMTFYDPGGRNPPGEGTGIPAGDTVIGRYNGDTWDTQPAPEFYRQDYGPRNNPDVHQETGFGGLARVVVRDVAVTTGLAPLQISSGGGYWFDNKSGLEVGREELYAYKSEVNFGKANGLGDVETLCGEVVITPTPTDTETPEATPTPEISTTPTDTPVTPTETPAATPTETGTPIPRIYRIYLPFTTKADVCEPDAYHADVVLVLDRSTSMLRSVEDGGMAKNEAAILAAKRFVSELDFTPDHLGRHDQVAVVGFNDNAWTELDLTNDPVAANAALDAIRTKTAEGTRLDLGMLEGQKPLDGPHHIPQNRPVIILLTDGLPNRVPTPSPKGVQEDTVLAAANADKAKGTRIYTIGVGKPTDIMPRLMIAMATERWMYYYVPRPEDLAGIYAQIAHTFVDCGPHTWPTPTPCAADLNHADIVLVIDMSTSMYRLTSAGRTKQAAAMEAAKVFVAQLKLEPDGWGRQDQAAVVGFNDKAWIQVPLSADRAVLNGGIDGLPAKAGEGTRLDLAFVVGQQAVEDPHRLPENRPVLILLTDGLPNRVPTPTGGGRQEDTVLKMAQAAKAKGTTVYTIGLGLPQDIDTAMMTAAASEPSMYYYAPDGEELARIYREIAGRITACGPVY